MIADNANTYFICLSNVYRQLGAGPALWHHTWTMLRQNIKSKWWNRNLVARIRESACARPRFEFGTSKLFIHFRSRGHNLISVRKSIAELAWSLATSSHFSVKNEFLHKTYLISIARCLSVHSGHCIVFIWIFNARPVHTTHSSRGNCISCEKIDIVIWHRHQGNETSAINLKSSAASNNSSDSPTRENKIKSISIHLLLRNGSRWVFAMNFRWNFAAKMSERICIDAI